MGRTSALGLASSLALGLFAGVGAASAADLLPPPPPLEPVVYAEPSGWYLRGDVGIGIAEDGPIRSTFNPSIVVPSPRFDQYSRGDAVSLGGGVGYQFNNWFRADVTGEYRTDQAYRSVESYNAGAFNFFTPVSNGRAFDAYDGTISSAVFLVNGYIDLGTWYGLTPFVGGGVGVAHTRIGEITDHGIGGQSNVDFNGFGAYGRSVPKSSDNFAYAGMAGVSYNVSHNLKLEFSYRYLNLGTPTGAPITCLAATICPNEIQKFDLASHDFRIGMRWVLDDSHPVAYPQPVYPAPPLVRKY